MYRTEFTSQPWKVQIRIHPGRPTALARVWTNLLAGFLVPSPIWRHWPMPGDATCRVPADCEALK